MKYLMTFILVLVVCGSTSAQMAEQARINETAHSSMLPAAAPSPFSLLDFSRVKWSHSYSVSFFSGNSRSGSMGLLNSTMLYEFSPKLSMAVSFGLSHSGGALRGDGDADFLPGFQIDYHPSDKFRMIINYQKINGRVNPSTVYGSGWLDRF